MVTNLVAQLDVEGQAQGGQIRLVPLQHATAQPLAAALTTLFNQKYQTSRSPDAQRHRPIIVPDSRGNSLLIVAGVEDNQAIDALLEKLDQKPENPVVGLTVIGLQHNDSARVAAMLTGVFAAYRQSTTAPGQPMTPQDQVHIQADPLSNALVISASAENLELLKGLLAQLDVEPVAQEGLIQAFTLQRTDAQRAATMLRSLMDQGVYRPGIIASGNRRSPRDSIAVTVDPRSNTLIVSASPENLLVVKELIKQIDSQDQGESADIRLFELKHARASQLATVLEQFFRSKRAGEAAAGSTERSIPVTVTPDDRTRTLLVTGGRETFAVVERMITQLDAEPMVARTTFKVVPLKQATAGKLQATLVQLFLRRPPTVRGELPDPITVVADSWANALIIGASPEDLGMVESLITQLDNDQTEPGTEVQVMVLAKADVRQVAQTITSLYRTGGPGTASPVTINVDERLNAVVVSAGQGDIKRIAELVKKLDSDQVAQVSEIRIFPLVNARAVSLASVLTQVLNQRPAAITPQSPNRQTLLQFIARTDEGKELMASALKEGVLVVPDARANSLVISAPVEYMKLLEQLIARLDESSPMMASIKMFALKNADARQMMNVLQSLFRLQATSQANANSRTIQYRLMSGVAGEGGPANGGDGGLASALMGTADENALTVTVDLRSNSLLIGGTEHYVKLASQIVENLDASPAQERRAEVYRLKNSRALEIQAALQSFVRQDTQLITAAVGQQAMAQELMDREAAIVAETNSNTLLISATPRNFDQLRQLVEQLDQPQRQVLIQVMLAEVTLNRGDDLGVEWKYHSTGDISSTTGTDFGLPAALLKYGGFASAISGDNFTFLFRALESEGRL
jgi:type II secretory pathway component GspD/PulD (secretin)